MSVWARHWALAQSVGGEGASRAARRCVLNDLADWMIGEDAVECCPTIEMISFDTGFNRQTVMKALAALVDQGLVSRRYEWEGLKKRAFYSFVGYVPNEWKNSLRPEVRNPEGPTFRTSESSEVRNPGGPKSHTTGGTKSRTTQGPKSHTSGGTKFRTDTGNKQGITSNERSYARARDFSSEKTEEQPVAASAQKPTTFPHDTLPDDWRDFCEREAPDIDPQRAFDEFRDYWISVDGRKNDWTAAWRNRIRGYRNAPDWKRTPVLKRTTGRTVNPDDYLPNSTMKRQSARDYSRGWDD